jgi:pimeloyl-ACP methyl ester carboxylesterase
MGTQKILLFSLLLLTSSNVFSQIKIDTTTWYDFDRNRPIPIAIITNNSPKGKKQEIVIFSHGYGQNKGGDYLAYRYLTDFLAEKGYYVVSIQHELPTDDLLPLAGIPQIVRRPFWERGADNILFVINELKKSNKNINFNKVTLIGHSNGGDISALFPQKHQGLVNKIITLDNRRMPLPRLKDVKVLSLRSSDQPADDGVLPSIEEQKKFKLKIVKLPNTAHNDMDDNANEQQRLEINEFIRNFLTQN